MTGKEGKGRFEASLIEDMVSFARDPLGCARYSFPWGEPALDLSPGPRTWQGKLMDSIGEHLRNPETRFIPYLGAVSSGHGVGKSAFVSMITHWGLSTCDDARIIITANSDPQLRTKTWPEINKWFRMAINTHWFDINAESITIKDKKRERTWRADRLTWSINNPQAFAGLHNAGKRILVIFDEASEIDDVIWEVTEGTLTDANTEIIWLVFGNPTVNTGRFSRCFGDLKHRWKTVQLDARTVEGTNKTQLQKWIDDYGEDSDFVRVRVRGEFPRAGSSQFIAGNLVDAARRYYAVNYDAQPKIMAIDVARFGEDQTIIGYRQGRFSTILDKLRGMDTVQVSRRVVEHIAQHSPDAIVVDGDGLGAGVVDTLRSWGYDIQEFHGSVPANDSNAYFNRRAEVWGLMRDWLRSGAKIDDDPELARDLTGVQYGLSGKQQIQLEKKRDMKKRGLSSPDCGDMLAMTFEVKPLPKTKIVAPDYTYVMPAAGQSWMN